MDTLETLQRRIHTIQDLKSLVRTMKALAAVNIRKYENAVSALTQYSRNVELGFQALLLNNPEVRASSDNPHPHRIGVVVFGSDQGMCGPLNDRITEYTVKEMAKLEPGRQPPLYLAVGAQVASRLRQAGYPPQATDRVPGSISGITTSVQRILLHLDSWRTQQGVEKILIYYSQHLSRSSYQPKGEQLLPLDQGWHQRHSTVKWPSRCIPMINMGTDEMFSALIQQSLFISIYRALAESMASENASRLASMRRAEKKIEEQSADLQLRFHQQRQSEITEELLDIIGAYEELGKST